MMLKTIRIYAEFYDGELNSAPILRAAELSPSGSVNFSRENTRQRASETNKRNEKVPTHVAIARYSDSKNRAPTDLDLQSFTGHQHESYNGSSPERHRIYYLLDYGATGQLQGF